ncbi:MAG: SurA N-terminal domain-containing protein [Lentisphaeria bacterium]|jgi:peptidyl-prolyl cis-trans isomerase SurA
MIKKSACIFVVLCCLAVQTFAQGSFGDALLAIVGDEVITALDVQMRSASGEKRLQQQFAGDELRKRIIALRKQILDDMIDRELVYLDFERLEAKIPQSFLQSRIDEIVKDTTGGNLKQFEERLFAEGLSMKDFKEKVTKDLAVELLLRERVTKGLQISDLHVDNYYRENPAELSTPARYRLGVIQLKKDGRYINRFDEVCKEVVDKIAQGTPFAELAKEYSDGANAADGGDQGWLSDINQRLIDAVSNMTKGQVTPTPIDFERSVFFVQLIDYEKGGVPELTPELREDIRKTLQKVEEKRRYDNYMRDLRMRFPVRRMDGND